jgi:hypothetical protein
LTEVEEESESIELLRWRFLLGGDGGGEGGVDCATALIELFKTTR